METLVISWREVLLACIVVLAVYAAEVLLLLRASGRREPVGDLHALTDMREELGEMRRQMGILRSELEQLRKKTELPATPYSLAIQMAQQGSEAAEVAANCGISRGEAELIVALYRAHS